MKTTAEREAKRLESALSQGPDAEEIIAVIDLLARAANSELDRLRSPHFRLPAHAEMLAEHFDSLARQSRKLAQRIRLEHRGAANAF
jgi:hypothetical protein